MRTFTVTLEHFGLKSSIISYARTLLIITFAFDYRSESVWPKIRWMLLKHNSLHYSSSNSGPTRSDCRSSNARSANKGEARVSRLEGVEGEGVDRQEGVDL